MAKFSKSKAIETLMRIAVAVVGGVMSSLAFPREGIWPLIFISVALITLSVRNQGFSKSLLIGFAGGLGFYLSQIEWLSLYLGPVPWLALSILEAAIFAIGMLCVSLVWSKISKTKETIWKPLLLALSIASIWTAREWVSISLPYGGFPWSRLSQSQSDSPLANWVYWGGLGGLTFVVAFVSVLSLIIVLKWRTSSTLAKSCAMFTIAALFVIPAVTRPPINAEAGILRVGAVQGNANAGLFANPIRGSILQNHLDASKLLADKLRSKKLDLVVWPENASDVSPFLDAKTAQTIRNEVDANLGVPLIFGTITARGDEIFNSSIMWKPNLGPVDWYDKKRPVPFAEYVPDRDFWYQLAPDLVGLISRGYSFGTRDGIFEVDSKKVGVLICFEIAIDDIGRDLVNQGAQVILSQTNNADFGHSDETFQQVAFAKLRAIETGRAVVNISTVGKSVIYSPDGRVLAELPTFESAAMAASVPLRTSKTPATLLSPAIDLSINLFALILIARSLIRINRKSKLLQEGEN